MYAEGETELRDLIIQNLETSGFLNKIKAELRAGVFIAFEEEGNLRTKIPLFNKKFDEFIDTSNGKLAVSLVREFLEFFNLNFTLSVFDPEIATSSSCLNRTDLCDKLNLKSSELDGPVLAALLKTDLTGRGKESKFQSNTDNLLQNSRKSLETISEDSPAIEKSELKKSLLLNDVNATEFPTTFDVGSSSLNTKPSNGNSSMNEKSTDAPKKSGSEMIDKLRNEHHSFEHNDNESNNTLDIFGVDKSDTDIFKVKANSGLDLDPFFDEPVPSEKPSFFGESGLGIKDISQNKPNEKKLSSLKDLPALTTTTKSDWTFSRDLPNPLSSFNSEKPMEKKETGDEMQGTNKNEGDLESNEESSDRQLNSEESIEEEIEEDFSGGLDDLLNSSLSLADDATTDQSASQISVVDGIDHIESVTN